MLKTFRIGGIHPNEHKLTAHCPVTPVAVPRQVTIMLNQHIGAPANCIVKKGRISRSIRQEECIRIIAENIFGSCCRREERD